MFSKITGEFETVEFAEFAAKHIREAISSPVKISIVQNRKSYRGLRNNEHHGATHGNVFYLLPTAVTSYNYITASVTRPVNHSLISEPLLNRTATIIVQAKDSNTEAVTGILGSYGGYNIKTGNWLL